MEYRKIFWCCVLMIGILIFIIGCATPPTPEELSKLDYGPMPQNYETAIKLYFDDVLFDPYSAHYEFQYPLRYWFKDLALAGGKLYAGYLVRVSVNAKNRYGGYTGKQEYGFLIQDERIIKALNEYELSRLKD